MTEFVSMYPCLECGEDVPTNECYEDFDVLMHAMGVTGQAEPHETGSTRGDLKRVDINTFAKPAVKAPDFSDLLMRDLVAYFGKHCGLPDEEAKSKAEVAFKLVQLEAEKFRPAGQAS